VNNIRQSRVQIAVGLFFIVWGVLFTASNFGLLPHGWVGWVFGFWPLLLVAFGFSRMMTSEAVPGRIVGGLIAIVGLVWTAEHLFYVQIHLWQWWPLLLVAIGLMLVLKAWGPSSLDGGPGGTASSSAAQNPTREFAMFSGLERRIAVADFRGTELTAIMGGVDIDLRGSTTATGEAVIDLTVIMGGVQIRVPPDWAVVNQVTPILGGVEDKSTGGKESQHRLIVRGNVILGGVDIGT
jgi:hypothetical protein